MTFDNEQQRQIILELVKQAQFPGTVIDQIYEFKKAVEVAKIEEN